MRVAEGRHDDQKSLLLWTETLRYAAAFNEILPMRICAYERISRILTWNVIILLASCLNSVIIFFTLDSHVNFLWIARIFEAF